MCERCIFGCKTKFGESENCGVGRGSLTVSFVGVLHLGLVVNV